MGYRACRAHSRLARRHPNLDDTRTSYDTVAVSYADLLGAALAREPFQRGILALFAELVRTRSDGPVADIGCGPGRITAHLHRIGLDAFGIDLSPAMIDVARRDHPGRASRSAP